jgi:DNA-binding LacI/PurR family transcriptional regulator
MTSRAAKRITSYDVAREAGVSQATVSYVFNAASKQSISEATSERVRDAANRLGYVPSETARTLRSGRSSFVVALVPDWPLGFIIDRMLSFMARELREHGFLLMIHRAGGPKEREVIARAVKPRAILALEWIDESEIQNLRGDGIVVGPAILDPTDHAKTHVFTLSQEAIGSTQVAHLHSRGHRNIGYASPVDVRVKGVAQLRYSAVVAECERRELPPPSVQLMGVDADSCDRAVRAWLAQDPKITAICSYNDEIALALVASVRRLGLAVPEDLAVIGVDDIPLASASIVPLTTVRTDPESLGRAWLSLILPGVRSADIPDHTIELIVREST